MEISDFFLSEKTLLLRENFLNNLKQRIDNILRSLSLLKDSKGTFKDVEDSFQETHRIKGAGGTYGFLEATIAAKDAIQYLRPFFNEKKIVPPQNAIKSYEIFHYFLDRTYKDLLNNLHRFICNADSLLTLPIILEYNGNRDALEYLQQNMLKDNIFLYSTVEPLDNQKLPIKIQAQIILQIDEKCSEIITDLPAAKILLPDNLIKRDLYKNVLDKIHNFHVKCN